MARILTLPEKDAFDRIINSTDSTTVEIDSDKLLQNLLAKRETALELSPELGLWFGEDVSTLRR
jgi:hypothetical protein